MKAKINIQSLFILFLSSLGLLCIGCDDAKNGAIENNRAYIKNADFDKMKEVFIEKEVTNIAIPINLTQKANTKVTIEVDVAEDFLAEFNKKYDKSYALYPKEYWSFESSSVNIEEGLSVGPVTIKVQPLSEELKNSGLTYAIPVTLKSAEGVDILNGSHSMVYVLKQVPIANVPVINGYSVITLNMANPEYTLNNWTVEFLAYIEDFATLNNKSMFYAFGKNEIYTRFENSRQGLDLMVFECKINDGFLNAVPSGKFKIKKWYHIAMVQNGGSLSTYIDGVLNAQLIIPGNPIVLNGTEFGFGGDSMDNTRISELRVWTIARTPAQIKDNMYAVNPKSEGLEAYWRMNEGKGKSFKDFTEKNPDAIAKEVPNWVLDEKLDVK